MNIKKFLSLLLCFVLLFAAVVGCGKSDGDGNGNGNGNGGEPPHGIDLDAAMTAFEPDTVMIKSGDYFITWAEFYNLLFRAVKELSYNFSMEIDWDKEVVIGQSLSDVALSYITDQAQELLVSEYAIDILGLSLSQEDLDIIQADVEFVTEMSEDDEEFESLDQFLNSLGYYNLEVFKQLRARELVQWLLITALYGEDLNGMSDSDVIAFAEEHEFMQAKHILLAFLREDEGYTRDEIFERAQDLLDILLEHVDDANFVDFFTSLMIDLSDDRNPYTGEVNSPEGYLFQPEVMVPPFSEATKSLRPGQMSGIVETEYGLHIILRLPLIFDAYPQREQYTLRELALFTDYNNRMQEWQDSMTFEFSPEYDLIDLPALFAWHEPHEH